jgi:hypothetical protein
VQRTIPIGFNHRTAEVFFFARVEAAIASGAVRLPQVDRDVWEGFARLILECALHMQARLALAEIHNFA